MRRTAAAISRWSALILVAVAAVVQAGDPDIITILWGGPFGPPRKSLVVVYAVAAALAILGWLLTPAVQRTRRHRALLALGAVSVPLAILTLVTRLREPFREETLHYLSRDGVPLVATLYVPRAAGPHPALVFVHGSPPVPRGAYDRWTAPLARLGFVVLMADKRGVGQSGGEFDRQDNTGPENIARLTDDVLAGLAQLRARAEVRRDRIGLAGISQAGWVAASAAAADTTVAFLALITGPTVSTREEAVWSRLRGDDHDAAIETRAAAESIIDTVQSHGVDARIFLGRTRAAGFWLFGSEDNSIPSMKSARVLDSLRDAGHDYTWKMYEGYGHGLIGRGGNELVPHIAPESWRDLEEWLVRHAS